MSVKPHLTSGASVRPEIDVTYSTGNEGQKICGVFSENASFKSYGVICLPWPPTALMRDFSMTEPSTVLEKANGRLNAALDTGQR